MKKSAEKPNSANRKSMAFVASGEKVDPPVRLRAAERRVFDEIVESGPRENWTQARLHLACQAAKCSSRILKIERALNREGAFVLSESGLSVPHPLTKQLAAEEQQMIRLLRACGLTNLMVSGNRSNANTRNEMASRALNREIDKSGIEHLIGSKQHAH